MRVPLGWLRDYVRPAASVEEIAARLSVSGLEVEALHRRGAPDTDDNHGYFVFGRVVAWGKHPNADRLRLCRVDTGEAEPRQIVCGAANFETGDRVVVALPGALLPGADAPLKRARLRGEASEGMMLSERELELSDDHDGIIVLPEGAPEPGAYVRDHVALADAVFELKVETNRGDCLSVYGVAREVAALFRADLAPQPGLAAPPASGSGSVDEHVRVLIEAPERCRRFTARAFTDVTIGSSPLWLRQRLAAAGVRPISNVVDITNYVAIGLGQPLHAYDEARIPGRVLSARLARPGERVTTLDGRERALDPDMLVIADGDGVSGLAGVMGGADSEIADDTGVVVMEAANFERSGVQRTSAALGLRTDASHRFARGVDPELAPQGQNWAAELMVDLAGATVVPGLADVVGTLLQVAPIVLRDARVEAVLGMPIDHAETHDVLARLGYAPEDVPEGHRTTVPSWRRLDTTREIDLVEEVARIHGLDRLPATLPAHASAVGGLDRGQRLRRRVEDALTGAGLREAMTITLVPADEPERYGLAPDDPRATTIPLLDPLTADHAVIRSTLVPSLLHAVRRTRSVGRTDVGLFELAHAFHPGGEELPDEPWTLALVLAGQLGGTSWVGPGHAASVLLARGVLGVALDRLGVSWTVEALEAPHLTPGRAARVLVGGQPVGELGEVHPAVLARFELDAPIAIAEIDLDATLRTVPERVVYRPLSTYPPVLQDVAVVVAEDVTAAQLLAVADEIGAPLLRHAEVFDVFRDEQRFGAGKSSVALRLEFGADDRTLTEDEASTVRARVVAAMAERLGAELRG